MDHSSDTANHHVTTTELPFVVCVFFCFVFQIRVVCLNFGTPQRARPSPAERRRVEESKARTRGNVSWPQSHFYPDSSAHWDQRSKQHNMFELHRPKALHRCFRKLYGHVFRLHYNGTCDSGLPGLSKEACLYACSWLANGSSVRQRGREWAGPYSRLYFQIAWGSEFRSCVKIEVAALGFPS